VISVKPIEVDQEYNHSEFEDDVFAILKDLFPNAVKWGQEKIGKAVPEGVFSIGYRKKIGDNLRQYKNAFSFDAKYTRDNDGYSLGISEYRKASDYVRKLNSSDYIASYADSNQLRAHIFIGNNFKPSSPKATQRYFEEHLSEEYSTIPVFVTAETLLHLHALYRRNYEQLMQVPNLFFEKLNFVLANNDGQVTMVSMGMFQL
jgi:hypothetical protein